MIYRVDENGMGVECGRVDVLFVKDEAIIAMMTAGSLTEASKNLGQGCIYYEFKGAKDSMKKASYELAQGCVMMKIVRRD